MKIIGRIIWAAVLLAFAVAVFVTFRDVRPVGTSQKVVIPEGDNLIIINAGSDAYPNYISLGQVSEVEGYTMTIRPNPGDGHLTDYIYTCTDSSSIDEVKVVGYSLNPNLLSSSNMNSVGNIPGVECNRKMNELEHGGLKVTYFTYTVDVATAKAAGRNLSAADVGNKDYMQMARVYIHLDTDQFIALSLANHADSEAEYIDDSELLPAINRFLSAIQIENT